MFGWALRHLAVVGLVAVAYALLQSEELEHWLKAGPPPQVTAAAPARPASLADSPFHGIEIPVARDGHYFVRAVVDGIPVDFVVDTGASDVALTMADAERLGFRRHQLDFSRRYQTANGIVRGAPVTLRELRIGQYSLFDVEASVTEGALGISLLGMTFLQRLEGYTVRDGRLVLHW